MGFRFSAAIAIAAILIFSLSCRNPMSPSEKALRLVWEKTYGGEEWEFGTSIQETSDGGCIISGTSGHRYLHMHPHLWKINGDGTLEWEKSVEGECFYPQKTQVKETFDGSYIMVTHSFGDGYISSIQLVKIGKTGNIEWNRTYEDHSGSLGLSVVQTTDCGYLATGGKNGPSFGTYVYLMRTEENGDTIWTRTFSQGTGQSIVECTDRGFVIVGCGGEYTRYPRLLFLKTDRYGNEIYTYSTLFAGAYSVKQTTDAGFILAGWKSESLDSDKDILLQKRNHKGITEWTKTYGGPHDDIGYAIIETSYGEFLVVGSTKSHSGENNQLFMLKTDGCGNLLWSHQFGGNNGEIGFDICESDDGDYFLVGSTATYGNGYNDVYLLKMQE
jgi:hypothetical protein